MQALRENLPKMQLPAGNLIFPGIGWPPNMAAPAAQLPVLGIPVPDLAGRVSLQHDLAAALSLHRPADSPAESAKHHQHQPANPPSASSEAAGTASGDGGALAGKLAALAASKSPELRSGPMKISHGTVEEEGKVQVSPCTAHLLFRVLRGGLSVPWIGPRCLTLCLWNLVLSSKQRCRTFEHLHGDQEHPICTRSIVEMMCLCDHLQATWAVVRAAVPLLKQLAGGKLQAASPAVAPELCRALACLCCRTSPCGRAFAGHIFKECTPDLLPMAVHSIRQLFCGTILLSP